MIMIIKKKALTKIYNTCCMLVEQIMFGDEENYYVTNE